MEIFYGCDNFWDSLPVRRRELWMTYTAFLLVPVAILTIGDRPPIGSAVCVVAGMALAIVAYSVFFWRRHLYLNALGRRWHDVPHPIARRAMDQYDKWWREAAIECHEGHIPGECPLCGAD